MLGTANQIAVFKILSALGKEDIRIFIEHAKARNLSEFEIESLRTIDRFHFFCQKSGKPEDYVDIFHLWTAERNDLDVFLTLDGAFQDFISPILNEEKKKIDIKTQVMKPLDLLLELGIDEPDPVPMEADRFYYVHEL